MVAFMIPWEKYYSCKSFLSLGNHLWIWLFTRVCAACVLILIIRFHHYFMMGFRVARRDIKRLYIQILEKVVNFVLFIIVISIIIFINTEIKFIYSQRCNILILFSFFVWGFEFGTKWKEKNNVDWMWIFIVAFCYQ